MGIVGRVDDSGETSLAAATAAIITERWTATSGSGGRGHSGSPGQGQGGHSHELRGDGYEYGHEYGGNGHQLGGHDLGGHDLGGHDLGGHDVGGELDGNGNGFAASAGYRDWATVPPPSDGFDPPDDGGTYGASFSPIGRCGSGAAGCAWRISHRVGRGDLLRSDAPGPGAGGLPDPDPGSARPGSDHRRCRVRDVGPEVPRALRHRIQCLRAGGPAP